MSGAGKNYAVFMLDSQGRVISWNESVEECIGKDDTEFFPLDVAAGLQEIDRTVIATGVTQRIEESVIQAGEIRTYLTTKDPYRDAQGNIIGVIGVAQDITQRKQFVEALSRSAQRLEALHEIDRAILRADSCAEIAREALARLRRVIPCQQAVVVLFDFEAYQAQILAGRIDEQPKGAVVPIGDLVPTEVPIDLGPTQYVKDLALLTPLPMRSRLLYPLQSTRRSAVHPSTK